MTREEAIQILSTRDTHGVLCGYTSGYTEALDMAIEALSAEAVQGCYGCRYYTRIPQKLCLRCKRYWRDGYERKGGDTE